MNWRFTILDFGAGTISTNTLLVERNGTLFEPVGWTDCQIDINRDDNWKGVFFDYSFSSLKWTGQAYFILKAGHDLYGIQAHIELLIEYYCPDCPDCEYQFFYQSRFNFTNYKRIVEDFCYIDVPLETSSSLLQFKNLYDQKVDLENMIAFDLSTPLTPYDGMGKTITLRNKTVLERTVADNTSVGIGGASFGPKPIEYDLWNDQFFTIDNPCSGGVLMNGYFIPPFTNVRAIEVYQSFIQYPIIGLNTITNIQGIQIAYASCVDLGSIAQGQYLVYRPRLLPFPLANIVTVGPLNMKISVKGTYTDSSGSTFGHWQLMFISYQVDLNGNRVATIIYQSPHYSVSSPTQVINFDFEYVNAAYNIKPGEGLWLGIVFDGFVPTTNPKPVFIFDGNNKINVFASTFYIDTPCKVFFVNEVMSRISEHITNGLLPVISSYYGRMDSQPFAMPADGEGGQRILTKGLIMRGLQARLAVLNAQGGYLNNFNSSQSDILNNVNIFGLSFQEVFDSLDAIDCVGMGLEDDPTRPGQQRLRIERFDYFFQSQNLMTLDNVKKIESEVKSNRFYSTMSFGYDKWETQSYDGLDEFLTKRQYRSTFTTVSNMLNKTCRFVASGYAIEYNRRQAGDSTQDSSYDNDTFIICLKPLALAVQLLFSGPHTITIKNNVVVFNGGDTFNIAGATSNNGTYTVISSVQNIVQTIPITLYGNDTIITVQEAVTTDVQQPGTLSAVSPRQWETEQGNVTTANGIASQANTFMVDPSTVYNWRISPFRNMLRWMKWLLAMYKNPYDPASVFVFIDGDGNYFATGQQLDPVGKLENSDVKESQNISIQILAGQADALPIFDLDDDTLEFPLSADEFVAIKANPYGLITYYHDTGDVRQGWIDKVSYSPVNGMAKFTLIPKR